MTRRVFAKFVAAAAGLAVAASPAMAADKGSSARQQQAKKTAEIPHCTRRLGTVAIVDPDNQWWRELNLGSPEAILKVFIQQSGCFGIVIAAAPWPAAIWSAPWPTPANFRPDRTWAKIGRAHV